MAMGKSGIMMDASADPATAHEIIQLLQDASSQDPSKINLLTDAFQRLEDRPGSFDIVHQIAAQKDMPLPVRQMAIIQFKNIVQGKWRSRK
jgi:hypothetical protein